MDIAGRMKIQKKDDGTHANICVVCDLPNGWEVCFSHTHHRIYFVHRSSGNEGQWSHPRVGNPLHDPTEEGALAVDENNASSRQTDCEPC